MVPIVEVYISKLKYLLKSPYKMTPTCIVVHNTYNNATARNERNYMASNGNEASFHVVIDDKEIIKCIPFNRNAWHAGDGNKGKGNRYGIAIEICFSKSGGSRFINAERNAAEYVASLLKEYGWGIDKVTKHQDYSGKYCPHRTIDMGWQRFLDMVKSYMDGGKNAATQKTESAFEPYLATVTVDALNYRTGPGTNYKINGTIRDKGTYTIVAEQNGWGRLKSGAGWICLEYTKRAGSNATVSKADNPSVIAKTIKVGSKVCVKPGTKDYDKGKPLASFVYNSKYDVIQIKGNRVVIGKGKSVIAAVHKDNLYLA